MGDNLLPLKCIISISCSLISLSHLNVYNKVIIESVQNRAIDISPSRRTYIHLTTDLQALIYWETNHY